MVPGLYPCLPNIHYHQHGTTHVRYSIHLVIHTNIDPIGWSKICGTSQCTWAKKTWWLYATSRKWRCSIKTLTWIDVWSHSQTMVYMGISCHNDHYHDLWICQKSGSCTKHDSNCSFQSADRPIIHGKWKGEEKTETKGETMGLISLCLLLTTCYCGVYAFLLWQWFNFRSSSSLEQDIPLVCAQCLHALTLHPVLNSAKTPMKDSDSLVHCLFMQDSFTLYLHLWFIFGLVQDWKDLWASCVLPSCISCQARLGLCLVLSSAQQLQVTPCFA